MQTVEQFRAFTNKTNLQQWVLYCLLLVQEKVLSTSRRECGVPKQDTKCQ